MQHSLFAEFPAISPAQWRQRIDKDLKGKPFEELVWHSPAGIDVQPFYTAEDTKALARPAIGEYPMTRGNVFNAADDTWQLVQLVGGEEANLRIEEALAADVTAFCMMATAASRPAWEALDFRYHALHVLVGGSGNAPALVDALLAHAAATGTAQSLTGTMFLPIGAQPGLSVQEGLALAAKITAKAPYFAPLGISVYFDGATIRDQIALALHRAGAFVMGNGGTIPSGIAFHFPVGNDFFLEIAKFRAFRACFAQLMESLGAGDSAAQSAFVLAQTAPYAPPGRDALNNLLPATTGAMAAVIGGANAIMVSPHDGGQTARGGRLARNVQHILRHEAHLADVKDPAGGSYAIETFTAQLAASAWEAFQALEQQA